MFLSSSIFMLRLCLEIGHSERIVILHPQSMKEHALKKCLQEGHMVILGLLIVILACRIGITVTVIICDARNACRIGITVTFIIGDARNAD